MQAHHHGNAGHLLNVARGAEGLFHLKNVQALALAQIVGAVGQRKRQQHPGWVERGKQTATSPKQRLDGAWWARGGKVDPCGVRPGRQFAGQHMNGDAGAFQPGA